MGPLRLRRFTEVDDFLDAAGPFLVEREAEHNLILGISSNLRETPDEFSGEPYLAAVTGGGRVVAAALQTPPSRLVLSEIDDPAAIGLLAHDVLDRNLPGVQGPIEDARAFAAAWEERSGRAAHLHMSERIFRLVEVSPPSGIPGHYRIAAAADRDLALAWTDGFMREAFGESDLAEVAATVDRWLARRGKTVYLWEDGGLVSLAAVGGPTPNGIRIGPVYTPPDARRRGYASALVAAVSQAQLDAGRRYCFLFTDRANETSNHIYQVIGYESVRDVDVYRFETS